MEAEEVLVAVVAVAAVSAALRAVALALRQPFTVAVFEQRRLFGVHTLPAEVSPARLPRRTSTTVAVECQL
jgi:hypothetical protein